MSGDTDCIRWLGLQLETETIEIDLTVVAGEGKLLGNLLCAVAGLLDP